MLQGKSYPEGIKNVVEYRSFRKRKETLAVEGVRIGEGGGIHPYSHPPISRTQSGFHDQDRGGRGGQPNSLGSHSPSGSKYNRRGSSIRRV
jgi:hypothetical protein